MFVIFVQVVNKVSSEQPLSLSIVRKKIEERFAKQNPPYSDNGEEFYRKMKKLPSVYYTTGEGKGGRDRSFFCPGTHMEHFLQDEILFRTS